MWSLRSPILCFLGKGRVGNFLPSKRIFLEQSWRTNSSIFQDLHDLEVVEQKRQPSPNIVQIHIYQTSLLPFLVKKHQKKTYTRTPRKFRMVPFSVVFDASEPQVGVFLYKLRYCLSPKRIQRVETPENKHFGPEKERFHLPTIGIFRGKLAVLDST